jgi:transposase
VETALGPAKLKPGARYSIDFAIEVAVAKYADHAPLERQVRIMGREGLVIDSQTLWDQIESLAKVLRALPATLKEYLHAQPVLGADETRWRMLSAKGKDLGEAKQWQVWGLSAPKAVYYTILDSRSADAGRTVLGGYRGVVMADGYGVYGSLSKEEIGFTLANCWAHVRRKYLDIESFFPVKAGEVIAMIGELYAVEREAAEDPDPEARRARLRGERSREIVGRIHRWALETEALPQSGLRKAIEYMGSLWKGLIRFLEDPRIPLDNNASERALRGPVVGRKNHYGSQSRRGTEVAALFYSAIESAKLAGVEPKAYLRAATRAALQGDPIPLPHTLATAAP